MAHWFQDVRKNSIILRAQVHTQRNEETYEFAPTTAILEESCTLFEKELANPAAATSKKEINFIFELQILEGVTAIK